MSVTVAVPGKHQTAYHIARYLEGRGELERLITPMPYTRTEIWGVSRSKSVTLSAFGYWAFGFARYGPSRLSEQNQLIYCATLAKVVPSLMGTPRLFNGWCTIALEGIRRGRALGIPTVLQSGSAHIGWQADILREEYARWKYEGPVTHPDVVARGITEVEEADRILVPSQFALRTFVERGVPNSKLTAVDLVARPLFEGAVERENATARILFVGSCNIRKGIPYLLEGFRRIHHRATLRLVGPIDRRLLRLLGGLPPGAEAIGPRRGDDLAQEYRSADILVMPSIEDGHPLVVSEAMVAGLPVVVTNHAGSEVRHGVDGYVVPARDSRSLAQYLDELVADPERRRRMGEAAREAVSARTWDAYGKEVYDRVLQPLMG
jgi:alpha-maltose-1-phosphate synthase